jgi:CheY-like chemotaxis protein
VEVRLPAAATDATPTPAGASPLAFPRGEGRSVLFVDDEPEVVALMTTQLRRLGFIVAHAASGVEALEMLEARGGALDAVVTDLAMPQMSGLDFAAEVRRRFPAIALALCSGYLSDADAVRARALGVEVVLPKPYSIVELARRIVAALAAPPTG